MLPLCICVALWAVYGNYANFSSIRTMSREAVLESIRSFGADIRRVKDSGIPSCQTLRMGGDYGGHRICDHRPQQCTALSFGIQQDWSFDSDLVDLWNCTVFAADPSVTHPSNLYKGRVYFLQAAANTLEDAPSHWHMTTSVPSLRRWLKLDTVPLLKMDCEGCEYSLASDVDAEEPDMWNKIQQFVVEIHVSKLWISSFNHVHNLALLWTQLREAGLKLVNVEQGGCAPVDEEPGCPSELIESDFPCYSRGMCINLLFARV